MSLIVEANTRDPDAIYERLIALHEGRSADDSARVNAKLIMLLINHIGDEKALFEAIAIAGAGPEDHAGTEVRS